MDVQCERCKTEYEFDDALVSGRGTTVKCTNCGFQFKVRPALASATTERWTVRTGDGTELVFTTLRELQRAITQRQVGRNDTLSRGNGPPRPLGHIAELEPFFRNSDRPPSLGTSPTAREGASTNTGFPGAQAQGGAISPYAQTTAIPSQSTSDPRHERSGTLRPMAAAPPPPAPPAPAQTVPVASAPARPPAPHEYAHADGRRPATNPLAPQPIPGGMAYGPPPQAGPPLPDRTQPTAALFSPQVALPPPTRPRYANPSYDDIETSEPIAPEPMYSIAPQRRRMGGWIVALVLTVGVGIIGYRIGQPYLSSATRGATPAAALDPKTAKYLSDGERAIEDGNLDMAKENFDKASAFQEKDPHVLLDVAKLAAIRADIPWLKQRILPESADDELKATKQQLADMIPGLKKAADDALSAAPDDAAAKRTKVDALRIAGEGPAARNLLAGATSQSSSPAEDYVRAALDLGEITPLWSSVIDRLRAAAAAEGNLGRARAALIYALAKNGDAAGASTELGRLSSRHPLALALRAFVQKSPATAGADAGAAPVGSAAREPREAKGAVDVNSLPHSGGAASAGGGGSADPRVLLEQAANAENHGDLMQAQKLYEDALRHDPTSSEVLSGLGSVALKQGDPATARQFFGRALGSNPNFMPALVGQADALWKEGDRNGAVAKYKEIVDRFPESAGYPSYVKTRAAGSASGSTPPPTTTEAPASSGPPTAPGGKPGELSLPANTPSDLPGTTPP